MNLTLFSPPSVYPGYLWRSLTFLLVEMPSLYVVNSRVCLCLSGLFLWCLTGLGTRAPEPGPLFSFRCHLDLTTGPWVCRHWTGMGWGGGIAKGLDNIRKLLGFLQSLPTPKMVLLSHSLSKEKQKENKEVLFLIKKIDYLSSLEGTPLFSVHSAVLRGGGLPFQV